MAAGFICPNSDCRKWVVTEYDFNLKAHKEAQCRHCEKVYCPEETATAIEETLSGKTAKPNMDGKVFSTGKLLFQSIVWIWGSWFIGITVSIIFLTLIYL